MKILTWNINGLRSMRKSMTKIVEELDGDIVCFQETKISRSLLQENVAVIDGYTSYFSFPKKQSGYSGVATYCRNGATPVKAEEGLTSNYSDLCEQFPDYDLQALDGEGRVLITYYETVLNESIKTLAIINVYCPRVDPEKPERHIYKMQFLSLLQAKAADLHRAGNIVIILGDLNISHKPIDHCDPCDEEEFNSHEARQWLTALLQITEASSIRPLAVDAFRHLNPNQKEAFTCWNTLTGARQTNYGTRIDYILISPSLVDVLTSCKILADVQGSDHCPVAAVFDIDIISSEHLPSICTQLWPEFAGRQQKLSNFIQKSSVSTTKMSPSKRPSSSIKIDDVKKKNKINQQKPITNFFKLNQVKEQKNSVDSNNFDDDNLSSQGDNLVSQSDEICGDYFQKMKTQSDKWKTILGGPPKPPLCPGHQRACVLRTVKKDGPNFGRQFFSCPQPNGLSTNPESSCNFFQWATAAKRNVLKKS